ncbi:MAG: DUF4321 domain-containing protein [Bacillota bacterium]|jgi:hypothetical protein
MHRRNKSGFLLVLFLVIGSFLGSLLGQALGDFLPFLNISSRAYGLTSPLVLNLEMFSLTLGFSVKLSVAGLIGLALALLIYRSL